MNFVYMNGKMGMTSTGSFTKDSSRWMLFSEDEKQKIEASGREPYGAVKIGNFRPTVQGMLEKLFKPDLTLILDDASKIKGFKANTELGSSYLLRFADSLTDADYDSLKFQGLCVELQPQRGKK